MKHFVCLGGCGGESEKPGVCQTAACPLNQKPLLECNCEDGEHGEAKVKADAQAERKAE